MQPGTGHPAQGGGCPEPEHCCACQGRRSFANGTRPFSAKVELMRAKQEATGARVPLFGAPVSVCEQLPRNDSSIDSCQ